MKRENRLRKNFLLIQLYYFFRSFIFAYVIERLFWRSRGISIADTVYIEIIYSIVLIVMEVPTGVWADRWSRKRMIVIGSLITFVGSIFMLKAYGFTAFALIVGMSGVSGALTSGSVSALLYDSLKEVGESVDFEKYLARIKAIRYSSGLIAALAGAFLASKFSLLLPYQLSVVSCFMMTIMCLLMVEPKRELAEKEEALTAKEIFVISKSVILNSHFLKYVFIVGAVIGAAIIYIEEFWQNYCDAIEINIVYFGVISALTSLVVIFAATNTAKVSKRIKKSFALKQKTYTLIMIISSLSFVLLFWIRHPLGILFMLILTYLAALMDTLVLGDIHHTVESGYRATVESVYAMLCNVMSMVIGLVFAWSSEKFEIFGGFLSIGLIIFIMMVMKVFLFSQKKLQSTEGQEHYRRTS